MEQPPIQQEEQNPLFIFDKRVIFLSLKSKILRIIVVAIVATIVGFLFAKLTIDDTWKARAVLIRHKKNMSSQTDMPYLYQELDFNTILQSVKIRKIWKP